MFFGSKLSSQKKKQHKKDAANPGRPKQVNLQKIFTPADDAPVILPQKNRECNSFKLSILTICILHPNMSNHHMMMSIWRQ